MALDSVIKDLDIEFIMALDIVFKALYIEFIKASGTIEYHYVVQVILSSKIINKYCLIKNWFDINKPIPKVCYWNDSIETLKNDDAISCIS